MICIIEYEVRKLITRKSFEGFHPFTRTAQDAIHTIRAKISVSFICGKGKCF